MDKLSIDVYHIMSRMNISDNLINETFKDIMARMPPSREQVLEECHKWTYVLDMFYRYYVPILSLCGIIGNLLSYLVFLNTYLKMRSSSYYLAALSAADFGFLSSITLVWINDNLGIPVFNQDGWCQLMIYISSNCSFLSVWLIVAFTVERFIAVQYPLHRPRVCTISRAKCIVSILVSVSLITHSYTFFTAGVEGDNCDLRETYHELMGVINIVDTLVTLIIPVGLIIIMNAMIAKNLFQFSKHFRRHNGASSNRSDAQLCPTVLQSTSSNSNRPRRTMAIRMSAIGNEDSVHSSYSECRAQSIFQQYPNVVNTVAANNSCQSATARCVHIQVSCGNLMSTRTQQSITKMLLLVSTVFVSLNFPSYIIRLYIFFRYSMWRSDPPGYLWCAQQLFMLLYYTNFSINFLLYSMCGITFRRCLFQLLRNFFKKITSHRMCM
ncbi:uncharacterized protein LOC135836364 isoform X2 [Planococcus citri]|uniref:uncharacterized protein LOC135836364 isoform X2 n=1 Tax=Planococcus citri TaxID=170843 RepID=UPI0031F7ADA5